MIPAIQFPNMIVTAGYTAHPENLGHNAQAMGLHLFLQVLNY